jgi:hypothetical protein
MTKSGLIEATKRDEEAALYAARNALNRADYPEAVKAILNAACRRAVWMALETQTNGEKARED